MMKARAAIWQDRVYLVRDRADWRRGESLRCEYATISDAGDASWTPCLEGVRFADIKPLVDTPVL